MKRLWTLLFALAALLAPVLCAQAEGDPVTAYMSISENRFDGPAEITVTVSVTNNGQAALPQPVSILDPDGEAVEGLGEPILGPGESVIWVGTWTVTRAQIDKGRILWFVRYAYTLEDGGIRFKTLGLARHIYGGAAESAPTPAPAPSPEPAAEYEAEYEAMKAAYGDLPGCVITTTEEFERILPIYEILARETAINPNLRPWVCEVTELIGGDRPASFTINAGSAEGVEPLHPVTFMGGLVGWVEEVREHESTVRTILYPGSEIPSLVNRGPETTVRTETGGDGAAVLVTGILPEDCGVEAGQRLMTWGGPFVDGIPIGTVTGSERDPQGAGLHFTLEPEADLSHLAYVIVLRHHPGENRTPTPAPTATAPEDGEGWATYTLITPAPEAGG